MVVVQQRGVEHCWCGAPFVRVMGAQYPRAQAAWMATRLRSLWLMEGVLRAFMIHYSSFRPFRLAQVRLINCWAMHWRRNMAVLVETLFGSARMDSTVFDVPIFLCRQVLADRMRFRISSWLVVLLVRIYLSCLA